MRSKQFIRWCFLFGIAIALSVLSAPYVLPNIQSQASSFRVLSARLKTLDLSAAQGQVGIGVMDLKRGESWFRNSEQRFPIA
jgi:beta-lactamase class A